MSFKKKPTRSYREPSFLAIITIRTTQKHKKELQEICKNYGYSLSELIRANLIIKSPLRKEREQ